MKTFIFFIFTALLSTSSFATKCDHLLDDCEYYSCIEAEKQCGKRGYPLGFGKKYCLKFDEKKESLSEEGQEWMLRVRSCLIQEMEQFEQTLTCKKFKKQSVKVHVPCYINSGYCQLSKKDRKAVIKIIRWSTWRPSILSAGVKVLKSCKN